MSNSKGSTGLFISPLLNEWQAAIFLELYCNKKESLSLLMCNAERGTCANNIFSSKVICTECKSNTISFAERFFPESELYKLEPNFKEESNANTPFDSACESTVNSLMRPIKGHWKKSHFKAFKSLQSYSISLSQNLENYAQENKINKLVTYNGRVVPSAVIKEFCKKRNIFFDTFEYGDDPSSYFYFLNHTTHDLLQGRIDVNNLVKKQYSSYEKKIAKDFYESKLKKQKDKKQFPIPKAYNSQKFKSLISIFTSSDDELSALGRDWESSFTKDMLQSIKRIVSNCQKNFFVLRVHPNQYGQGELLIDLYKSIEKYHSNLLIIYPKDNINSYDLISKSDAVITFGSTITMEAVYMRKPTVLLGKQKFDETDSIYVPRTLEEASELINSNDLKEKTINGAIAYSLYVQRKPKDMINVLIHNSKYYFDESRIIEKRSFVYLLIKMINYFRLPRRDISFKSFLRLIMIKIGVYNLEKDTLEK